MNVYEVTLRETNLRVYRVEADSRDDAIEAAKSGEGVLIEDDGEELTVVVVDEGE